MSMRHKRLPKCTFFSLLSCSVSIVVGVSSSLSCPLINMLKNQQGKFQSMGWHMFRTHSKSVLSSSVVSMTSCRTSTHMLTSVSKREVTQTSATGRRFAMARPVSLRHLMLETESRRTDHVSTIKPKSSAAYRIADIQGRTVAESYSQFAEFGGKFSPGK